MQIGEATVAGTGDVWKLDPGSMTPQIDETDSSTASVLTTDL